MTHLLEKLFTIHNTLQFTPNKDQLKHELPEQLMALKHIHPDDIVLELGGSIGRNSCVINSILNNKNNHVVVEPNLDEATKLEFNRDINKLEYMIETSVISDIPLYSKGWRTYNRPVSGSIQVPNLTYDQFYNKYNLKFNVLVIDNEGNFVENLKTSPNILNNIRLILIEHDFNSVEDLEYFTKVLKDNGFTLTDTHNKTDKFGPGMNWSDGIKTDPIFVSAWIR